MSKIHLHKIFYTTSSFRLSASGVPSAIPPRHCVALSPLTSSGAQGRSADFRLPAVGFRLPACLRQSPPRHCVALSPPDKQWGAREYIGARHPPLDRGGQGRSADFRLLAAGCWLSAPGSRLPASGFRLSASGCWLSASGF